MDGFGGAYAAWKKFGNRAEYIAVDPETLPNEFPEGREMYAVDVSYPIRVQREIRKKNKSLVVIDHHISRKKDTSFFRENIFKNTNSGAVLAWKYFHKDKKIPKLLLHIEDIDLWKFKLGKTKEIISVLEFIKQDFKTWDALVRELETKKGKEKVVREGALILQYRQVLIDKLVQRAVPVVFEKRKAVAVNSPVFNSEIAHLLIKQGHKLVIVWAEGERWTKASLRSNGKIDVSKIAQKYNGGGHKAAAGFGIPPGKKLPWKRV